MFSILAPRKWHAVFQRHLAMFVCRFCVFCASLYIFPLYNMLIQKWVVKDKAFQRCKWCLVSNHWGNWDGSKGGIFFICNNFILKKKQMFVNFAANTYILSYSHAKTSTYLRMQMKARNTNPLKNVLKILQDLQFFLWRNKKSWLYIGIQTI